MFNTITGINESKTLTKQVLYLQANLNENLMEENVFQNNDGKTVNIYVRKKRHVCKKDYIRNHTACICESGQYLASIMDDSTITCDEIIESYDKETKTVSTNFNGKKTTCKTQNFYILLVFLLIITIALMIAVSIYCYSIKYWAKQKHLLPFHSTNNELKEVMY